MTASPKSSPFVVPFLLITLKWILSPSTNPIWSIWHYEIRRMCFLTPFPLSSQARHNAAPKESICVSSMVQSVACPPNPHSKERLVLLESGMKSEKYNYSTFNMMPILELLSMVLHDSWNWNHLSLNTVVSRERRKAHKTYIPQIL